MFARRRPSHSGDYTLNGKEVRVLTFRTLPVPTGQEPYRLDVKDVISAAAYQRIVQTKHLVFHLNGDMGGINEATPQQLVAKGMEQDFSNAAAMGGTPAFLYVLGDCVYFSGEVTNYYAQFYHPYELYPAPIFAVPGNHDGENIEAEHSLDGFVRNFCAPKAVHMPEAGDSPRTAMTQPNVYWTLLTPLVNIVGLYSNVPDGGKLEPEQIAWLVNELATLPARTPILVALHHPVYSADNYHSGSLEMKQVLEQAGDDAGRHPDMVIAGHVHNYQRLTKYRSDGTHVPYLITGAGGYHNLHSIQKVNGETMIAPVIFRDKDDDPVHLEAYTDDHHGFLRVDITPQSFTGRYYQVPRPQEPYSKGNQLVDYFEFGWRTKQYKPNTLGPGTKAPTKRTPRKR